MALPNGLPELEDMTDCIAVKNNICRSKHANINIPIKQTSTHTTTNANTNTSIPIIPLHDTTNQSIFHRFLNNHNQPQSMPSSQHYSNRPQKIIELDNDNNNQSQSIPPDTNNTSDLLNIQSELRSQLYSTAVTQSQLTRLLLTKLTARPDLMKQLSKPDIQHAFTELQSNPTAAIKKYSSHHEINLFLIEFMKLMGNELQLIQSHNTNQNITSK